MIKKMISVFGDSISTYDGFNPTDFKVYYKGQKLLDNELSSVNQTWWKQVIDFIGGELCVNNSYSGSLVVGLTDISACSKFRCSLLHGDSTPDIILVYLGTNDRGFDSEIGRGFAYDSSTFYGAYRTMLRQLKENYPSAKILCGTLLMGYLKEGIIIDFDRFMRDDERYNEAIRRAVIEESCLLVDIAKSGERYETLDYCHPTKKGHSLIAKLWIENLKNQVLFEVN